MRHHTIRNFKFAFACSYMTDEKYPIKTYKIRGKIYKIVIQNFRNCIYKYYMEVIFNGKFIIVRKEIIENIK